MAINSFNAHTPVLNNRVLIEGDHPNPLPDIQVHENLKKFVSHLENALWELAYEDFQSLPEKIQISLFKSVNHRKSKLLFDYRFDLENPEKVIEYCLTTLFLHDPASQHLIPFAFKFLKEYVLPETQKYILKNFEREKNRLNVIAAQEVVDFAINKITRSSNNPNKNNRLIEHILSKNNINKKNVTFSNLPIDLKNEYIRITNKIDDQVERERTLRNKFIDTQPKVDGFLQIVFHAQLLSNKGNCSEFSLAAFYHALEKGIVKKVDIYRIDNGDHTFAVYKRKNKSYSNIYFSWGKNCKILDPWTNKKNLFPSFNIPLRLENYIELNKSTGMPKTERFNPKKHTLDLYMTNIYSLNDFIEKTNDEFDQDALKWFQKEVDQFHSSSKQAKVSIANKIISEHPKAFHKNNRETVKALISQMRCFLDFSYVDVYLIKPKASGKQISNFHNHYVTAVSIDHILKIADLFEKDQQNQTMLALKKFKKVFWQTKNYVFHKIQEWKKAEGHLSLPSGYGIDAFFQVDGLDMPNVTRARALYSWVIEKLKIALENKRDNEAKKIFNKLPGHIRQNIESYVATDVDLAPLNI